MGVETRSTDAKGRVSLPKAFANATVIIERVSDTEVRIKKAVIIPQGDVRFYEETVPLLSDRDRFLHLLDDPAVPNEVLKRAVQKHAAPRD